MKRCLLAFGLTAICLTAVLSLGGCVSPQARLQSAAESERDKDLDVRTIGDFTEIDNANPVQVSGVGLVTGLDDTGHSPLGTYRTMLEQFLRKQRVEHVKAIMDDPRNALVLVTAKIPPGVRKGDPIDVEVSLPQGSKATSLRGGYLEYCQLHNYSSTRAVNPEFNGGDTALKGHVLATAKGPLLVGFGNPDEPAEYRRGRLWQGGVSLIDRPFFLVLKKDESSARIANAVAEKINLMFQEDARTQQLIQARRRLMQLDDVLQQLNQKNETSLGRGEIAKAVNKEMINLRVPYAYRFNSERYLRVARLMPLRMTQEQQGKYNRRLEKMLLDPADTVRAALRLEALGKDSVPMLKKGLHSEYPLVRFASAEALTYLGSTAGVDELARLTTLHPQVRFYGLTALAGLDESICRSKLGEMLVADDSELRCGAFRAMRLLEDGKFSEKYLKKCREDGTPPPLGAELLGSYWLHHVGPKSTPLVHFSVSRRAEIILFGEDTQLVTPVKVLAGDLTITADRNDDRCTVGRVGVHGVERKQCSLRLEDVLRTMTQLGGDYPEAVELLRKLKDQGALTCPIMANIAPMEMSVEELAEQGRDPAFLREVLPIRTPGQAP